MVSSLWFSLSSSLLLSILYYPSPIVAVWPAPRSSQQGNQPIRLSSRFSINYAGLASTNLLPTDLKVAAHQTLDQINSDRHQPLSPDRGQALYRSPLVSATPANDQVLSHLRLEVNPSITNGIVRSFKNIFFNFGFESDDPTKLSDGSKISSIEAEMKRPFRKRDESYRLKIVRDRGSTGTYHAVLAAPNALGIFRGLQTFTQLVYTIPAPTSINRKLKNQLQTHDFVGDSSDQRFIYGPLNICDSPAFPYRGLMLDTARNFYPIGDLYRTIEAMSWAKLNVLHWHIVDAQSWPLEIQGHPELVEEGAYSPSEVYTAEEVRALARYANSKGVEIMLEIDTPGHTAIIGESHPDLIACKDAQPWNLYAAEPPSGQLRFANDGATELVKNIFRSASSLVPGTLFSTGGDEINKRCYEDDEVTQDDLTSKNLTLGQALDAFVSETHQVLRNAGKTPVVWEELVLDERLNLPSDTIVAVWRNSSNVRLVADEGYSILHASSDFSYLDCGLGGWLGNSTDGNSWCDPFKTWQKIYSFDPYANITTGQRRQIIGGQTLLWSEQASTQNLDSLIWPRALSAAEVYWTGENRVRTVAEALPRIHDMRYRMVQRGIRATPLQPHWCALRPGSCDFPPLDQANA